MTLLVEVGGSFAATHIGLEGMPHAHIWTVRALFEPPARVDATVYRAALDAILSSWDGKPLPPNIQWNEDIALAIGTLVNCVEVSVYRDAERLGARWRA